MVEDEPGQKDAEVSREDTLLRKRLMRLTIAVGTVLALALVVSLVLALRWYLSPQTDLSISQRQDLVQGLASAGQAVAVLLTGAVALIGLYLTRQNTNKQLRQARESTREQLEQARESTREQLEQARESQERTQASAQETLRLTEQGQITERFTRAIEQLGATDDKGEMKLEIRLGGIYALERIALDSPERDYSTVMEVLTAYVRENAPWPTKASNKSPERSFIKPPERDSVSDSSPNEAAEQDEGAEQQGVEPTTGSPRTDIQAILDILNRREENRVHHLELQGTHLQGANLQGANLRGANLRGANLSGAGLEEAILQRTHLQGANLRGANLRGADLRGADLQEAADLRGANLQEARLQEARLQKADLQRAILEEAHLEGAHLEGASLEKANLQRAHLQRAILEEAHLEEAHLERASLEEANLQRAHLEGAPLDEAHLEGAKLQRAHLEKAVLAGAFLTEADLWRADLRHLQGVDNDKISRIRILVHQARFDSQEVEQLQHHIADLQHFSGVSLRKADLREANLQGAILIGASLTEAKLRKACFKGAILIGANLQGASVRNADFEEADLSWADLSGADRITNEELDAQAHSLEGATMPNGQKYEDWLNDKEGSGKDLENE
jgi:uncharacterized protein YjbI with pentapeptide repeats